MQVCFIGHRTIEKTEELRVRLKESIIHFINKGATSFLFGSKSAFDHLSWQVVTQIKKEYPFIRRIYVRADYPKIDKAYEEYLLGLYEETYYPPRLQNAGKYAYVERNYEMIDNATYCIFYYNENHVSQLQRRSGTKIAYAYAVKKKKEIVNLYL
ncbi:MAG: hypothetical protein IJ996_03370 [Clostridia bacterium]|nr:hypothetical protein [Clostridia bacterium]